MSRELPTRGVDFQNRNVDFQTERRRLPNRGVDFQTVASTSDQRRRLLYSGVGTMTVATTSIPSRRAVRGEGGASPPHAPRARRSRSIIATSSVATAPSLTSSVGMVLSARTIAFIVPPYAWWPPLSSAAAVPRKWRSVVPPASRTKARGARTTGARPRQEREREGTRTASERPAGTERGPLSAGPREEARDPLTRRRQEIL